MKRELVCYVTQYLKLIRYLVDLEKCLLVFDITLICQ